MGLRVWVVKIAKLAVVFEVGNFGGFGLLEFTEGLVVVAVNTDSVIKFTRESDGGPKSGTVSKNGVTKKEESAKS
jgi:hypothetical protein